SGEGLWRIRHGPGHAGAIFEKATTLTGLVANGVMSLLEDRDGNIWVGTRGLNRLTPQKVTPLTDIGLVNGVVSTPDGGIWVLNADEVIRIRAASGTAQREHISFHGLYLGAIHRDRAGALWVATNSGLRRWAKNTWTSVRLDPPLRQINCLTSDSKGTLWIADVDHGLFRLRDGVLESFTLPAELASVQITSTYADTTDRVWLTYDRERLAAIEPDGS